MRRIAKAFLAGMLMVLLVSGCSKENPEIVAEVNGIQVTREQLDQKVAQFKNMFQMQGFSFDGEEGSEMLALLEKESLNQLITEALIYDEAKKLNLSVSQDEVQSTFDEMAKVYGKDVFLDLLKQQNMTEKQFKKEIELMLLQNSLYEKVTADVKVTEEQLKEYFEANKENLIQYRASHILIMPDAEAEDKEAADEAAKAKAMALIEELNAGADFAELAKANSADGSAANGGDLGQYFTKAESPYVPEFTAGVVSLEVGEYSKEPVESFYGYHIIKLMDKKETFEELKDDLEARLLSQEKSQVYSDYFSKLMEEAKIVNYLETGEEETSEPAGTSEK